MMSYQLKNVRAAETFALGGSSRCGPEAPAYPTHGSFSMGGRAAAVRPIQATFPPLRPLGKPRRDKALLGNFILAGTQSLAKEDKPECGVTFPQRDFFGRDFFYNKTCAAVERSRTVLPPLPSDRHVHRSTNQLHPFSLSRQPPCSHTGRPFTLSYPRQHKENTGPTFVLPSTFVLNGTNAFTEENCKLSRPKVNYPTYHPVTVKDEQKSQSYPDPLVGAPRSFIHRISELSSLEGETERQEKLKKKEKSRKPPS